MIEKFLDAIDDEKEYDFIAQWYNNMSKYELKTILLEYIYAARTIGDEEVIRDEVRDNLIAMGVDM